MVWIFFNIRICSFLTELTVGKAKVVRPEQNRLLLERTSGFAGGGSHRFNHFLAELATGQIFSFLTELSALRLSQGLDFAPQNLG